MGFDENINILFKKGKLKKRKMELPRPVVCQASR